MLIKKFEKEKKMGDLIGAYKIMAGEEGISVQFSELSVETRIRWTGTNLISKLRPR